MNQLDSIRLRYVEHLSNRFVVFLFAVLGLVSLFFLLLFFHIYTDDLARERTQASQSVSLLLKSSLERSMLRRDLPGLRDIINDLGKQAGVKNVMILNLQGEVRFASRPEQLGQAELKIIQQFCPDCPASKLPEEPVTHFVQVQDAGEVLRTFHPVKNKSECTSCHGTTDVHPVNGILIVDYDAAPIRAKGWMNMLMLVSSGLVALLFSAWAAWWFMQRYVLQPVRVLDAASRDLSLGKLNARVPVTGVDEMANLGKAFNSMAEQVQQSHNLLKSREQFLQDIIDAVPDGVRVINPNYQIVVANQAYAEQSGYSSPLALRQQFCHKITYQRDSPCPATLCTCPFSVLNAEQPTLRFMETLQQADGSSRLTEVYAAQLPVLDADSGQPAFWVVEAVRDINKAMHYSHEQKLASLGVLAAGVGHEIHNPLASIRIALQASDQILDASHEDVSELRDYLHLVDERVEQCLDVTHRLMRLGSLASSYPELVDVNLVIHETLSLLRFEREQNGIREHLGLDANNPRILAADNDLRMIILNLVQNAFHAMSPEGGCLSIFTCRQGGQVKISVEDTGVGIADEVLPHVFDPFFSRRHDQRGSGLGLTITRSLVQQHGGTIQIMSHLSGNTVFMVSFPDADADIPDTEVVCSL